MQYLHKFWRNKKARRLIFIPHVKEHKHKTKKSGKMLLIIDNAPGHPSGELLGRNSLLLSLKIRNGYRNRRLAVVVT
ncbi:hypothetical protein T10_12684 [Trichinella papuae]|uniref:DDE-1 domain-containing protein n=1 Tax=Trichinella papuae TaxID=268474 RepID=A0A0V1M1D1_9BILA|nr:hypothetical protein T10_12684 [Trichinella papuae]